MNRSNYLAVVVIALLTAQATPAIATPQFARQNNLRCVSCHSLPPKLNEAGLAFQSNGYRAPKRFAGKRGDTAKKRFGSVPLAAWITARAEDKGSNNASDFLLPKVELISGGTIGSKVSYFVEWRIVSRSLNSNGSLGDRGGRFEDLFAVWSSGSHSIKVGQYRSVNQVDVSLRLSASEPLLFQNSLFTGESADPRISSLRRFSPSSRSPSIGYSLHSLKHELPSDGLFHFVTVPFIGELSIPLGSEASEAASFELTEPAKGVFFETFYRRGVKSLGAHAFYDEDSWLVTLLGTYDWRGLHLTGGFGIDDQDGGPSRQRASFEGEYLFTKKKGLRGAAGFRVEDVSDDGKKNAYVPYLALSFPNFQYTYLLQFQFKAQEGGDTAVLDLSALF